jgi:hypothetical protein
MRILLVLSLFLFGFGSAHAQITGTGFLETSVSLELQPSLPSPLESYAVTLNNYSSDFYGAEIQWYINDQTVTSAFNKQSLTLNARSNGTSDVIKAVLKNSNGATQTVTTTVKPLYLDIIVEPQTHVPDFYAGRALPSVDSTVNLTALVEGVAANASAYIYTWQVNNKVLEGGPLKGRNEISFTLPQDSLTFVSLLVAKSDGTPIAKRIVSVPSVTPKLVFYEVSTLYGLEPKAITKSFALIGNSATLRAEPYFLSSFVFNNPNIITWSVAGEDIGIPSSNPYDITLQKTGFPGTTDLGFHVRSTDLILQGARKNINVSI